RVLVPGDVLGPLVVGLEGGVRLLLGEQLIEGLALLLLLGRGAEPYPGRPPLRGSHPPVERVVSRATLQRVGRVLHLVIREVSGLVAGLVGHLCLLSVAPLRGRARRPGSVPKLSGRPAGHERGVTGTAAARVPRAGLECLTAANVSAMG